MLYLNQWLVYTQIYTVTPKILDRLSNIFRYTPAIIGHAHGNSTTREYANSRTGQVAEWTTRGLADAAKRTKTKHAKSPVAGWHPRVV